MIRYDISPDELRKRIKSHAPKWFTKVQQTLASLPVNPSREDFVSLWSDIKEIYIDLQCEKCVYCEMEIEGNISNDVEHYRPKAKVSPWKVPKWLAEAGMQVTAAGASKGDSGYIGLAYEPWNYAASCKVCNSVLKRNLFPIRGPRQSAGTNPRRMKRERPLLIYPIGRLDKDPATLIRFVGIHPEQVAAEGRPDYFRALATIELFRLDDAVRRKALFASRARLIGNLYGWLENRRNARTGSPAWNEADDWVQVLLDSSSPHTNCLRCFDRLYASNPDWARDGADQARLFLKDRSLA